MASNGGGLGSVGGGGGKPPWRSDYQRLDSGVDTGKDGKGRCCKVLKILGVAAVLVATGVGFSVLIARMLTQRLTADVTGMRTGDSGIGPFGPNSTASPTTTLPMSTMVNMSSGEVSFMAPAFNVTEADVNQGARWLQEGEEGSASGRDVSGSDTASLGATSAPNTSSDDTFVDAEGDNDGAHDGTDENQPS